MIINDHIYCLLQRRKIPRAGLTAEEMFSSEKGELHYCLEKNLDNENTF